MTIVAAYRKRRACREDGADDVRLTIADTGSGMFLAARIPGGAVLAGGIA
jgi:hypothetical protein